jgi:hypothetical protein
MNLVVAPLCVLGSLSIRQVDNEGDALVSGSIENGGANQDGHSGSVFLEELFLVWLYCPSCLYNFQGLIVAVTPLGRRQVPPAHATKTQIFATTFHHLEKGFIGLKNHTFEIPDEDTHNVGVDQTPDLRFAFF